MIILRISIIIVCLMLNIEIYAQAQISKDANIKVILTKLQKKMDVANAKDRKTSEKLRKKMRALAEELAFNPIFVFGKEDKYIIEGMSNEFERAPKPLKINQKRKQKAIDLELNHIALYHEDRKMMRRIQIKDSISLIINSNKEISDLKKETLDKYKQINK